MDTSLIISYKESGDDRRFNLKAVLNYLLESRIEREIIIVEQDTVSRLDWLINDDHYNDVRHIFLRSDSIFNKGWGYNVGAKQSNGRYLIFSDADILIPHSAYLEGVKLLDTFDVVDPYREISYLTDEGSHLLITFDYGFSVVNSPKYKHYTVPSTVISGGVFMISREKYFSLRGFDEDCFGFGFEDNIFDTKIKTMGLSVASLDNPCIHLHHKSFRDGLDRHNEYYSFFKENESLYNKYLSLTKEEMTEKINGTETWGEITKNSPIVNQMEAFWKEKHETNNVPSLSGNSFEATVEYLKIEDYIKPNTTVLEVGVGLGYVTKRMHNLGMRVSAVDICDTALNRVDRYCEATYNADRMEELPNHHFDLIICNAVVQHIDTLTLVYELRHIMRSLKPGGLFALQFVSSKSFEDNGTTADYVDSIAGRLCRTPQKMKSLIERYGGKCTEVRTVEINISFLTGSHVFHVTKQ